VLHWRMMQALRKHLPPPLSGIDYEEGKRATVDSYKSGLGYLPASYFDAVSSICKTEEVCMGPIWRMSNPSHCLSLSLTVSSFDRGRRNVSPVAH
jgi:hypothetical protein